MSTPTAVPRYGLSRVALLACLDSAVAAPSVHNSQPWRFRIRGGGVDVFADRTRQLAVIDPLGRELLISVGAAILNLRIAVLARGRLPVLQLLPPGSEPDLVARVVPGPAAAPDPTVRALAGAIPRRRTSRLPFHRASVPDEVIAELVGAASAEGATLRVADPPGRAAILGLVRTAEEWQRAESGYRAELTEWTLPVPGRRDGVPAQAFGPRDPDDEVPPVRDFGLTQPQRRRRQAHFEPDPTVAVLDTVGDRPADWLRAGQALERVLLTATVRGLAATPMTQPLESPELRPLLTDVRAGRFAQVILRLGYAPPAAPVPRRPLDEVLIDH
jgi:nitroreductase